MRLTDQSRQIVQATLPVVGEHIEEIATALRRQVVSDVLALRNASIHLWYEDGSGSNAPVDGVFAGTMDLSQVKLPDGALYYLCGPLPFMQAVRATLLDSGVEPRDIQYEVFGPNLWQADVE